MTVLDIANAEQRAASNPTTSAFVAASAGSGKTKLLTDRLLRLMLAGTPPARILCLTYTKAAAAEMAIRLNRRLGAWVVMPSDELDAQLAALDVPRTDTSRNLARKLFADVLDLPGGMRINTIHAFCQSLLRRFPLEAGLSPHFELADDNDANARLRESRELVLANPAHRDAIDALAAETNEQDFATLTARFAASQNDVQALVDDYGTEGLAAMQRAALEAGDTAHDEVLRAAVAWTRESHVKKALHRFREAGNPSGAAWALARLEWLAHDTENRVLKWVHWVDGHFTKTGRRSLDKFYGKGLAAERDALSLEIEAEHQRIEAVEERRKAARLAAINADLTQLIAPILINDQKAKVQAATLSYADLITQTGKLLFDPGAAWILYKLDGGIDHLLLDEVQDTAPAQWDIADAIAAEFFAGQGAKDVPRSIFAVGDAKQSIFSFQGADLRSFEHYRAKFRSRAVNSGNDWLDGSLSVSFRSTAPVLALVDAVFAEGQAQDGVVAPGATLSHGISRAGQAGKVTLWPLTRAAPASAPPPWEVPDDYEAVESSRAALAREIAIHIGQSLAAGTRLPSRNRQIAAGDILILVRRRDELVTAITRACKERGIPIAGQDRMVLTEQQAVSDLLALCDALLLPEDDLAFGQFLASPLGGLSDNALMHLAMGHKGSLAAALFRRRSENAEFAAANTYYENLRDKADYVSPHALLAEALGPLGGRARLLQRLGPDAAEPIDELLAEALAYAKREPGSLQMFVHHLRQSGAQIKREADAAGDVVRIMTVHGAKGLQAPVVILPDTTGIPQSTETLFWLTPPQQPDVQVPIFCPRSALRSNAVAAANTAQRDASLAEQNRLLYVALTRAEDELIICGALGRKAMPEQAWYKAIEAGFSRLGATVQPDGRQIFECSQDALPDRRETRDQTAHAILPAWAGRAPGWAAMPPAQETTRPEPLAPSRSTDDDPKRAAAISPLGGGFAEAQGARQSALARGRAIHALLQHLPDVPVASRAAAASRYLARITEISPSERAAVQAAVLGLLGNPTLAPLFAPGSQAEIPLAGVVNDIEIAGVIDRLAVTAREVLLADYKTDRAPPARPEDVSPAYLRQLSAYQAILAQIYPAQKITCLLIYTQSAFCMPVPSALLAGHAPA